MGGYEWQDTLYEKWKANGLTGVVRVAVGGGKTIGGIKVIKKYQAYFPYDRVWVIANSKEVISQWKNEAVNFGVEDVEFFTYNGALSKMNKLTREGKDNMLPDMMVLDECHCINAPSWGRVMDFGVKRYLGLSATPNGSERKLGGIILHVDWGEANIADTSVYLVKFKPTASEMKKYDSKTKAISTYKSNHPNSNYKNDMRLQMMYNGRRSVVNKFESRYAHVLPLIEKFRGEKMMIFCIYHEQALTLSKILESKNIPHTVHITGMEGLDKFTDGEVDICISCKKLNTGFNYPAASVAIIMATATSPLTATQTLGRVVRPDPSNPDKKAKVVFLLADGTNDMSLKDNGIYLKDKMYETTIEQFVGETNE